MTDERTQDRDNAYAATLRENRELRAQLSQAHAALREIVEMGDYVYKPHEFADIARAALGEKP